MIPRPRLPQPLAARLLDGLHRRSEGLRRPTPGFAEPGARAAGLTGALGRIGSLEVRLATTRREVKTAQRLRYRVFFEEMSAVPDMLSRLKRRDIDAYDMICDHMLVVDHGVDPGHPRIVGTYRLLRQEVAQRYTGFYTQGEFDVAPLVAAHPDKRFLELGRSCVLAPYRDKRTVELLWHGIWTYVLHHRIDVMFGCASLEGIEVRRHAMTLAFLHHNALAPPPWRIAALPHRRVPMDVLPPAEVDGKAALRSLPPLVKGYLRLGAWVGEGAVVDHQFGTTDVLVVLPVSSINPRYIGHFGADAARHAV